MANSKGHESRRYLETLESRFVRHLGVNLHLSSGVGQDYESIARIERLDRLPAGEPLRIQDPQTFLFTFLPGVDGVVS